MTMENEQIKERYDAIKAYAQSGAKVLPEDFDASAADGRFFELMTAHTFNQRRGVYDANTEQRFDRWYFNKYLDAKRGENRAWEQAERTLRAGMLLAESRTYLIKPLQTASVKDILRHLFTMLWVYSGQSSPVEAEMIFKNVVPVLLGCATAPEEKAAFLAANHLTWTEVMGPVERRMFDNLCRWFRERQDGSCDQVNPDHSELTPQEIR